MSTATGSKSGSRSGSRIESGSRKKSCSRNVDARNHGIIYIRIKRTANKNQGTPSVWRNIRSFTTFNERPTEQFPIAYKII